MPSPPTHKRVSYEEALEKMDGYNVVWIKNFSCEVEYYGLDDPEELTLIKYETLKEEFDEFEFYINID